MGTNAVQRDATAEAVSANVIRLRSEQNLGLRALSDRLKSIRPSLRHSTIDAIERGTRRVDVDDLVALALALKTTPATLLMPAVDDQTEMVAVTGMSTKESAAKWWLYLQADPSGAAVVGLSPAAFIANTHPTWQQARWIKETRTDGND